jgi:hypothetical protein
MCCFRLILQKLQKSIDFSTVRWYDNVVQNKEQQKEEKHDRQRRLFQSGKWMSLPFLFERNMEGVLL